MAWSQLWIDKPHLAYAIIGGFTTLFSLVSLFVKEKLYIGEATVASLCGVIFGPYAASIFDPISWGNTDRITLELSRIILVIQIFAVGVELPKKYMRKHWISVFMLLVPVMAAGWLLCSLFIWWMVPVLSWNECLVVSGCITATDPILASAVVGKGKFAKRVPGHLRNILSAESGCNDGMAYPFVYVSLYILEYKGHPGTIVWRWVVITILYECVFGTILGVIIGYTGRRLIKFAVKHNLIDRESFLVFYFVLALFCTGIGTILGVDDLLVSFAAGASFAWDGWFSKKTEESHVSDVIDLLLNLAYFVYFGAIIPWNQYNATAHGIHAWRLVVLAIFVLLFRRLPAVLLCKPFIPDIRTWREAFFCGHFGPIGVGAVFISIVARAELEHEHPTPLAILPPPGSKNYAIIEVIWPIVTFLIVASILIHGSSIAVFTLGKRINTMAITMSVTNNNNGPSWMSRFPRTDSSGRALSIHKIATTEHPPGSKLLRLRRVSSSNAGHIPAAELPENQPEQRPQDINAFQEGHHIIVEDNNGEVLNNSSTSELQQQQQQQQQEEQEQQQQQRQELPSRSSYNLLNQEQLDRLTSQDQDLRQSLAGTQATAYQVGNEILIENNEGEVVRRYMISRHNVPNRQDTKANRAHNIMGKTLGILGLGGHRQESQRDPENPVDEENKASIEDSSDDHNQMTTTTTLTPMNIPRNFLRAQPEEEDDDEAQHHPHQYEMSSRPSSQVRRRLSSDRSPRISFAGETAVERRRRLAALGIPDESSGAVTAINSDSSNNSSSGKEEEQEKNGENDQQDDSSSTATNPDNDQGGNNGLSVRWDARVR